MVADLTTSAPSGGDTFVRPFVASDGPALRELFIRSRTSAFPWRPIDAFRLGDFDEQTKDEFILVAERDGIAVGFLSLWQPDEFIHHLFVDPAWMRCGVGSVLLHALPGWPTTRYRLKCLSRNVSALAFYSHHGFIEIGSGVGEDGDYRLMEFDPQRRAA